jgi:hypothetical protein
MLSAVHARGEQGWKSGHLEPFSFALRAEEKGSAISYQSSAISLRA